MDGYLYLQVNRDFEISNVVINPNATADYETSVPTLVKKIAIGPEATQEGFEFIASAPTMTRWTWRVCFISTRSRAIGPR